MFTATLFADNSPDAEDRVARRLPAGFAVVIGSGEVHDARHGLFSVLVEAEAGADRDRCWVILTSFGISPSASLGSHWERTLGVGA
jgi:hypothetical protein